MFQYQKSFHFVSYHSDKSCFYILLKTRNLPIVQPSGTHPHDEVEEADGEEEDKKADNREADHHASRGLVPVFNLSNINCMYFNKKCL